VAETVPTESHLKEELVVLAEEGFDTSAPAARTFSSGLFGTVYKVSTA
jgi:hypothetical protein